MSEALGECNGYTLDGNTVQPAVKRLPRSQKKKLAKERYREKRRQQRQEKRCKERKQIRMERKELLSTMTDEERNAYLQQEKEAEAQLKQKQESFLQDAYDNGLPICVNCSFQDKMNERELKSLAKQLSVVYSRIKNNGEKIKLSLTGISEQSQLYEYLQVFNIKNWKLRKHEESFWDIYDHASIVVLSPDADTYLEELEMDKVYVIGGLVDKHVQKKTTLLQAEEHGFVSRALPIPKYFPECNRKVLNIDAVCQILVMRANNSTWLEAFQASIPTRAKIQTH